jgi:pimeloyl-ACP methyl ester carboxylesterase
MRALVLLVTAAAALPAQQLVLASNDNPSYGPYAVGWPASVIGFRFTANAPVLEDAFGKVWNEVASSGGRAFAGGKSMGGRISSQATAAGTLTPAPAGLVFFGYPLHPPGKPSQRRDKHLPAVEPPMLFVHGTRDPFGTADEMRALIGSLSQATLHLVDEGDHSLAVPKRRDPDGRSLDTAMEVAAAACACGLPAAPRSATRDGRGCRGSPCSPGGCCCRRRRADRPSASS